MEHSLGARQASQALLHRRGGHDSGLPGQRGVGDVEERLLEQHARQVSVAVPAQCAVLRVGARVVQAGGA